MTCFSPHKSRFFVLFLAAICVLAPPARAADRMNPDGSPANIERDLEKHRIDRPIVVELFTATDCSACVIADRLLYDVMKDKNIIALSCHIQDLSDTGETGEIEGKRGNAKTKADGPLDPCVFRQWAYKSSGRRRDVSINIPEFIVNGDKDLGTDNLPIFYRTIESYHYDTFNKTLDTLLHWKDKNTITIGLPQAPESRFGQATASVWLVRYKDMQVEKIDSGVNQGKVLRFSNIIQDIQHVGKWRGNMRSFDVDVTPPKGGKERGGYAVIVQEVMGSPILAAGKLADYPMPNDTKNSAPNAGTEKPVKPAVSPLPKHP